MDKAKIKHIIQVAFLHDEKVNAKIRWGKLVLKKRGLVIVDYDDSFIMFAGLIKGVSWEDIVSIELV